LVRKRYKNSPIIEAVCEIQFEEHSPWDGTTPGLVYEKVKSMFPIRRQATRITLGVTATSEEVGPQLGTIQLTQFFRKDEKALIQVGPNVLSINVLKPYPSWRKFLPLINKGLTAYLDVAEPQSIQRIGLRYINHINISSQSIKLEDYFEFRPFVGPNLPQDYGAFGLGIQIPYQDSKDMLSLQIGSLPNPNISVDQATLILSLDYYLLKPKSINLEEISSWVETAHTNIEDVFEACITQKLKDTFEEVKE